MISEDDDVMLVVTVIRVRIGGLWYELEIAVLPNGQVYSIVQVGLGRTELW